MSFETMRYFNLVIKLNSVMLVTTDVLERKMKIDRVGNNSGGRESGKKAVFAAIRQNAPVARIDIAQETGLSPATVTSITAELIAKGLIEETPAESGQNKVKRGRPRVDLQVRSQAHLVAGMKLSNTSTTVVIVDYVGNRIAEFSTPTPSAVLTALEARDFLKTTLLSALKDAGMSVDQLSGVGIGLPGVIDTLVGVIRWSPMVSDRDAPLTEMLGQALGIPVFLENDANVVALAEQHFGLGKNTKNFIVITIEQGVGMGIVIDGKLIRGVRGSVAELGHTKVQLDGALCRCGQRGCLEAYVGDFALLREATTIMGHIMEPATAGNTEQQMQRLLSEARAGNQIALSIFRRAGRMFAMGLANVVNIFAPELIILSGERMQHDYLYDEDVIRDMNNSIVQMGGPLPDVRVHKSGDQLWALGAATCAIQGVTDAVLRGLSSNEG